MVDLFCHLTEGGGGLNPCSEFYLSPSKRFYRTQRNSSDETSGPPQIAPAGSQHI